MYNGSLKIPSELEKVLENCKIKANNAKNRGIAMRRRPMLIWEAQFLPFLYLRPP